MKSWNTQQDRILQLLKENSGRWVPSYDLAAIALQYGARVFELRRIGHCIENRLERCSGVARSWFRLVSAGGQASLFDAGSEARPPTPGHWLEAQRRNL